MKIRKEFLSETFCWATLPDSNPSKYGERYNAYRDKERHNKMNTIKAVYQKHRILPIRQRSDISSLESRTYVAHLR